LAVWLLAIEALVVAGTAGWAGFAAVTARSVSAASAWGTAGFAVVMAAVLGGLAVALWRLRSWARGPAIVTEMLMVPMGYYMLTGGSLWWGVPMMIVGVVGAGALLAPSTRADLGLG
jgi:hypothetical protein